MNGRAVELDILLPLIKLYSNSKTLSFFILLFPYLYFIIKSIVKERGGRYDYC